ncbi:MULTISPECIES: hypothetical protein [Cupriavidus]|uniref:hypothetical protein n=1 Tax=Cupriavidus TaxID=106589 RepID=UPI0012EA29AE|nr:MULTISPECIES: hypothetical protein [Cupriavidus]
MQIYLETHLRKTPAAARTSAARPTRPLLARLQAFLDAGWQRNLHHAQALARVYANR